MHAEPPDRESRRPSDEELYAALCSSRRLHVLRHLWESGGTASLSSLVETVASAETDKPSEDLDRKERRRVYISLYQTHLPKLDDQGIVSWDRDEDVVHLLVADQLDGYLIEETASVVAWDHYYLSIAAVSLLFTVLVGLEVWVFSAVEPTFVGTAAVCAIFSVAVVHRFTE